jgi:mono/diheme cytochrome c family protein
MKVVGVRMLLVALSCVVIANGAHALPFNDDMVAVQKRTGVMMRQKAPGTVAIGMSEYYVATKQDAEKLVNPKMDEKFSAESGRRLWRINCYPCHGDISKKPWQPGPVAAKLPLVPPDPSGEAYKSRSDGFFYGTIHFGGAALMPPLGWKMSPSEHWDIVNYIRLEQAAK